MTKEQAKNLANGLYRLFWQDGSSSVAAVGRTATGAVWFAPTNWINGPWLNWAMVRNADLLEPEGRVVDTPLSLFMWGADVAAMLGVSV